MEAGVNFWTVVIGAGTGSAITLLIQRCLMYFFDGAERFLLDRQSNLVALVTIIERIEESATALFAKPGPDAENAVLESKILGDFVEVGSILEEQFRPKKYLGAFRNTKVALHRFEDFVTGQSFRALGRKQDLESAKEVGVLAGSFRSCVREETRNLKRPFFKT